MKNTFFLMLVLAFGHCGAQIKDKGFEKLDGWVIKGPADFVAGIDSVTKNSGAGALKIKNVKDQVGGTIVFSQDVPYKTNGLKLINLSFFIKTNNVILSPAIWCEVKDHNDRVVGFANSVMQRIELKGTNDWKKYSIKLLVSPQASHLVIGGYQKSAGEVWFDDVEIADAPVLSSPDSGLSAYADEIKNHIKNSSLFRDSINWSQIDTDLNYLGKAIDMQHADLLNQYFIQELRNAGDMHSQFQNKIQAQNYASNNVVAEKPRAELLKNNIAYLYVPGFGSTNSQVMNKFADTIQQLIRKLDTENEIKGWIVDLRRNSGGNMFPMIGGVGPLTGTGARGYF
jgi:flagellar basal body rod protein FlgB